MYIFLIDKICFYQLNQASLLHIFVAKWHTIDVILLTSSVGTTSEWLYFAYSYHLDKAVKL